ncbi:hypothetical protein ACWEPB_02795 [Kitasatospora cineracea]
MTVRAAWLLNPGQTRQDTRLAPVAAMTPIDAMTSRSGVIPGGTPFLLTGSGMSGSLAVGRAYIQGTTAQGAYPAAITVAEPITVANGHASLPRIDSVFLTIYDNLIDSSGLTLARIDYVQGTAAASPTAPSAPGNASLRLWDITVPAGASAGSPINWGTALTDRRLYTVAVGGIATNAVAGAYSGQYRDTSITSGLERYNGTAWESRLYLGVAGQVVIGTDVNLYRGAANQLKTDDDLLIGGALAGASNVNTGAWTSYTPTWTAVTTNPTVGNGTLVARWCRTGRKITYIGSLTLGSNSNGGTGIWLMSLPVAAAATGVLTLGDCDYINVGDNEYLGKTQIASGGSTMGFIVKTGTNAQSAGNVSNSVPVGASSNTRLHWNITYEAAS